MPSYSLVSSSITKTSTDQKNGSTFTASFLRSGGTKPTSGCTVTSVAIVFSSIKVYTGKSPKLTTNCFTVNLTQQTSTGSQTPSVSGINSANTLALCSGSPSITFTVGSGASASTNVFNIREGSTITITINYSTKSKSSGTLSLSTVEQGYPITVTLTKYDTGFTHQVTWKDSGNDSTHEKTETVSGSANSSTLSGAENFDWQTGACTCVIETYMPDSVAGDYLVGTTTLTFQLTISKTKVIPTSGTLSVTTKNNSQVNSAVTVPVQGYCSASLSLASFSSGGYGAEVSEIEFSCGAQKQSVTVNAGNTGNSGNSSTSASWTTGIISQTGDISCTAKVKNSYGNSASATPVSIHVYPYTPPVISSITATRCDAFGTADEEGAYIKVKADIDIVPLENMNFLESVTAQYRVKTVNNSQPWSAAEEISSGNECIIGGNITSLEQLEIRITAKDAVLTVSTTADVMNAACVVFFKDGGENVSIGMQGTRNKAVEINADWKIYHGNTEITAGTPQILSIESGGTGAATAEEAAANLGITSQITALQTAINNIHSAQTLHKQDSYNYNLSQDNGYWRSKRNLVLSQGIYIIFYGATIGGTGASITYRIYGDGLLSETRSSIYCKDGLYYSCTGSAFCTVGESGTQIRLQAYTNSASSIEFHSDFMYAVKIDNASFGAEIATVTPPAGG